MDGHGSYIWPAYGLTALIFLGLLSWTRQILRARRKTEAGLAALGRSRRERSGDAA